MGNERECPGDRAVSTEHGDGLSKVHAKATTKRDGASAEDRDGTGRGGRGRQTEQEARRKRDGCPRTRMPIARAVREYACTRERRRLLARRERASETGGRASEIADDDATRGVDDARSKYLIRSATSWSRRFPRRSLAAAFWSPQSPGRDTSPFLNRRPSWFARCAHVHVHTATGGQTAHTGVGETIHTHHTLLLTEGGEGQRTTE